MQELSVKYSVGERCGPPMDNGHLWMRYLAG